MLALAVGCAESEPRTFESSENPCGLDRPTRAGGERLVAWDAYVVHEPFEALRGDALFVVGRGEHVGLWRMPAIP